MGSHEYLDAKILECIKRHTGTILILGFKNFDNCRIFYKIPLQIKEAVKKGDRMEFQELSFPKLAYAYLPDGSYEKEISHKNYGKAVIYRKKFLSEKEILMEFTGEQMKLLTEEPKAKLLEDDLKKLKEENRNLEKRVFALQGGKKIEEDLKLVRDKITALEDTFYSPSRKRNGKDGKNQEKEK